MSTPARSRSSTPLQPTRQQLDELIELMQQMLALPESPVEEAPDARVPPPIRPTLPVRSDVPLPGDEPAANIEAPVTVPRPQSAAPARPEPERSAPPTGVDSVAVMSVTLLPLPASRPATSGVEQTPDRALDLRPSPAFRPKRSSVFAGWWWPVLRINRGFDRATAPLEALGRWLRGPRGRRWLGWSGLALLSTALAGYLLLGMGWTW